jgi:Protein of unknown function (DUF2723)
VTRDRWVLAGLALVAGAVAFGLALQTLLPGLYLWDTGELQTIGPVLGTGHPTGFPAWVILGWLASIILQPLGDPAHRMNLLSAILGGVAAGATVLLVIRLTSRRWIGLGAGLLLATLPIAWQIATRADVHALYLALLAILLGLLVDWERRRSAGDRDGLDHRADRSLVGAALIFGIALATHTLSVLLVPGIGLYVLAVEPGILRRRWFVWRCLGTTLVTLGLLYLELPLRAGPFPAPLVYGQPNTLTGFLYVVLGAQFAGTVGGSLGDVGPKVADLASLAVAQFGPLAWLIPVALVVTVVRQPRYALLTVPGFVLTCLFAASYQNAEIWRYLLGPSLIAITWLAVLAAEIVGLAELALGHAPQGSLARSLAGPGPNGAPADGTGNTAGQGRAGQTGRTRPSGLIELVLVGLFLVPALGAIPATWRAVDRSADRTAPEWLAAVLPKLDPHGVVISWWSYSTPLWYAQIIELMIPQVSIVDDRTRIDQGLGSVTDVINANLGKRPIYLIRLPADLAPLQQEYTMTLVDATDPGQPVYQVTGRVGAQP